MTLVIWTVPRSSPIAASMRSSNCPLRPTNGRPRRSSSAPGASPMIMTGAAGLPSRNTVVVAVRFSGHPSNAATSAPSASIVSAPAASRRADWAASASDPASAPGGLTAAGATAGAKAGAAAGGADKLAPAVDGVLGNQIKRFRTFASARPPFAAPTRASSKASPLPAARSTTSVTSSTASKMVSSPKSGSAPT